MKMPTPVAYLNPVDSYSTVTATQKETNEFQFSDEFLAAHTNPLYTEDQLKQLGRDLLEEAAKTLRNIDALHATGLVDVTIDAIRAMKEQL